MAKVLGIVYRAIATHVTHKTVLIAAALITCLVCSDAIAQDPKPESVSDDPWFKSENRYPYLESGELGEKPEDAEDETREWGRRFPFLAQQVIDLGYELPNPYGAGMFLMTIEQDLILTNLQVGFNQQGLEPVDFVTFGTGKASHQMIQAKADFWLFPFMNLFVAVGHIDGNSDIPLSFPGDEALKFLLPEVGQLCDLAPANPLRPEVCDQTISNTINAPFTGESLALGTNLAMGWKHYFVMVNLTYAVSQISLINEDYEGWTGSTRIGFLADIKNKGQIALYLGAMYLDVELDLTGQLVLPAGSDPAIGEDLSLEFSITQRNADKWNALLGFNWDYTQNWSFNFEAGFGGSRNHLLAGVTWRF